MRRRISYANITATLALVFAMSGGAIAAQHYLINSTRQISPKVLRALRGASGTAGTSGSEGREGREGKEGREGREGKEGREGQAGPEGKAGADGSYATVLPAGVTETGAWGAGYTASGVAAYRAIASFPIPLAGALNAEHAVYVTGTSAAHCPGLGKAEGGYLCVYQRLIENAHTPVSMNIYDADEAGISGAGVNGFGILLESSAAGMSTVGGAFAVTAP